MKKITRSVFLLYSLLLCACTIESWGKHSVFSVSYDNTPKAPLPTMTCPQEQAAESEELSVTRC